MFTDALPKLGLDGGGFGFDSLRHHVNGTASWIRESLCALRGHDMLLQFTHDRMFDPLSISRITECAKCDSMRLPDRPTVSDSEPCTRSATVPSARSHHPSAKPDRCHGMPHSETACVTRSRNPATHRCLRQAAASPRRNPQSGTRGRLWQSARPIAAATTPPMASQETTGEDSCVELRSTSRS